MVHFWPGKHYNLSAGVPHLEFMRPLQFCDFAITGHWHLPVCFMTLHDALLKAKIFTLGEWYSCRGLAVVTSSGVLTLGFKIQEK